VRKSVVYSIYCMAKYFFHMSINNCH